MPAAADSGAVLCHINLARGFRGGERQTEILVKELAPDYPRQLLITHPGFFADRVAAVDGVRVELARTRIQALALTAGTTLVHAHETWGAQVAWLRRALTGTPYIITRRVDNVPRPDPLTRSMYTRAERVVVLSRAIGDILAAYDPRIDVCRIPSSISDLTVDSAWVEGFRRAHAGRFIVGTIGALDHSHKGQLVLIEAARRIAPVQPDIHFVLVGSGRDEQTMRQAAAGLGNVSFAGWSDNVGNYLAAFDLFAFPSLHEGFGSVLTDAMQFGLPIVASAVGGIVDLVTDQENGLLVAPGDAGATAEAILRLYRAPALRQAMAAASRSRGHEYLPSVMAARYTDLYRKVLGATDRL